jgi:predicted SAM-dependent methyltransferase
LKRTIISFVVPFFLGFGCLILLALVLPSRYHPVHVVRALHARLMSTDTSKPRIETYLKTHAIRKLQIGAGTNNIDGWLNSDIEPTSAQVYLDATKRFPLPDKSVSYIYAEQLIEHLSYDEGRQMFAECRRVLVPGGKLRLATPDLRRLIAIYESSGPQVRFMEHQLAFYNMTDRVTQQCSILNMYFHYWGHKYIYDKDTLRVSLESSGFQNVSNPEYGKSDDPVFFGIERHFAVVGPEVDLYTTMIAEASARD